MAIRHQRGRNPIGQPALFADLLHQAPAKPAAADDVVDDIGGIPVGVVALRPGLAEADGAFRLVSFSGQRGQPPRYIGDERYTTLQEARHGVFLRHIHDLTEK